MFLYLATIFVGQAGTCMAELGEALSRADSEHARLAAHALRGSAATIGALPLADLFAALEERLAAGGAAGPEAFAPIEEAFDRVRSWLERDGAVSATTSRPGAGDTALSSRSRG
jgi:HPt (histidine-containing phosphotransfer) domain-containing protein